MRGFIQETLFNCYSCIRFHSHRCQTIKYSGICSKYRFCDGYKVRRCKNATVRIFEDKYIHCPIKNNPCEKCTPSIAINTPCAPPSTDNGEQNYNIKILQYDDGRLNKIRVYE